MAGPVAQFGSLKLKQKNRASGQAEAGQNAAWRIYLIGRIALEGMCQFCQKFTANEAGELTLLLNGNRWKGEIILFRKIYLGVCGILIFILNMPSFSYAHPGRTDANGGHTCRTNCEKWGLEYGEYHYHNGGSSSGGGGGTSNNTPSQAPNDNQQKFEEQRKQEELARQKAAEAEEERKKAEKEKQLGKEEGAAKAAEDFEEQENDPDKHLIGKSSHYVDGFKESYVAVWNEKKDQKNYYQKGYKQGLDQEKINLDDVPKNRLSYFEEGFDAGNAERVEKIKKEQYKIGKKHGLKKEKEEPGNTDREAYVKAYQKGYKAGLKKTIIKEGKKSAKTNYNVKVPKEYKDNKNYSKWYKQGFKSNKKAAEVRKAGFKKGKKFFSTSRVPKEYKKYEELYKEAYKKGKAS